MSFKSFKIKLTLLISAFVLIICFVLVGTSVLKFEDLHTYMEELETNTVITGYKAEIKSQVQSAVSIVESCYNKYKEDELSENSVASTEEVNASVEEVNALMSSVSVTADNLSSEVENLYKQLDVFKL